MPELMDKLTKQLRRDEGEILHAYTDHLGYWTIGVGRLIDKRRGGGITKEESAYLLNNDITKRYEALQSRIPWINNLSEPRIGVLVNMSFQLGVEGLMGFYSTITCIRNGKYEEAADNMRNSLWYKQTPVRAERLCVQMITDEWQ